MKIVFEKILRVFGIKKRQPSIIRQVFDDPEKFILEAFVEGEEIIMKIKKRRP